jgi:bacteriocin biosynthesis cyclodehydratase domain-containing protein
MPELSASPVTLAGMRPVLKRGLLPVWRDRDTLQIGIDSRRAVALTGMAGAAWVIGLLDGSRDRDQVVQAAAHHGIPAETTERVLALLATAGALDDFPAGTLRLLSPPLRARLATELAAASLARRDGDGGARTLARRLTAQVRIHGAGTVGDGIASLLTSSGIGQVTNANPQRPEKLPSTAKWPGTLRPRVTSAGADGSGEPPPSTARPAKPRPRTGRPGNPQPSTGHPGGPQPSTGRHPGSPQPSTGRPGKPQPGKAPPGTALPDLAILVGRHLMELRASLMRDQVPHLAVSADEAIGVVGPLVIPGRTACLRCLDLTRAERDPAWPLILAQLEGREPNPCACDAPLAAAVAAQAAAQVLAFIDRPVAADPVANGTLELVLPGWQWRRRTWPRHPGCSCGSHAVR